MWERRRGGKLNEVNVQWEQKAEYESKDVTNN